MIYSWFLVSQIYVPTNPRGAESLPPGIVVSESDFYLRRLWGEPSEVRIKKSGTGICNGISIVSICQRVLILMAISLLQLYCNTLISGHTQTYICPFRCYFSFVMRMVSARNLAILSALPFLICMGDNKNDNIMKLFVYSVAWKKLYVIAWIIFYMPLHQNLHQLNREQYNVQSTNK